MMSFTLALKKVLPVFALTLMAAFAAQAAPTHTQASGIKIVDNTNCPCQPTQNPQPAGVAFSIAPATPTVYYSNYPLGGGDYIPAPWFMFVPSFVNNSGRTITIMTMDVETVFKAGGIAYTDTFSVVPDSWGGVFQSIPGKPIQIEQYYIGPIDRADSSVYQVTLHLDGWYGTANAPQERFHMDYTFNTK